MPQLNSSEKEPEKKRQFIREKIARPPMTRRQAVGRFFAWLFIAVLGGAAAGASYAVVTPLAKLYLEPQATEESIVVTIPKMTREIHRPGSRRQGQTAQWKT